MSVRVSHRHGLSAAALSGALCFSAFAAADDAETAKALFERGVPRMEAGDYEAGCRDLAESLRLDPRLGTLFTVATCEERWGRVATAVARWNDYLARYERLPEDKRSAQGERPKLAKAALERLSPQVPELLLALPPDAPAGTIVTRNGQVMAAAALGVGLSVDPGEHVVTTRAPGGTVREQRITLGKGEKKKVILEVVGPPRIEPRPTPVPPEPPSGRRVAAYVTGGAALASLAAGGILGGLALAQKPAVDRHCGRGIQSKDDSACDPIGLDAAKSAKSLALGSTIAFTAGAAGLVTAAVLLLSEPKRPKASAGAPRPSISAGVITAGPESATLGVRGVW